MLWQVRLFSGTSASKPEATGRPPSISKSSGGEKLRERPEAKRHPLADLIIDEALGVGRQVLSALFDDRALARRPRDYGWPLARDPGPRCGSPARLSPVELSTTGVNVATSATSAAYRARGRTGGPNCTRRARFRLAFPGARRPDRRGAGRAQLRRWITLGLRGSYPSLSHQFRHEHRLDVALLCRP
jgi:hypothetical protein